MSLDEEDQARMVKQLGGEKAEVCARYWRVSAPLGADTKKSAVVQMKIVSGRCIFYVEDGEGLGGCSIHKARPWRCGQWPLHPAILGDENNFITIRESCPGVNQELSYQEFCSILRELMQQGKIQC